MKNLLLPLIVMLFLSACQNTTTTAPNNQQTAIDLDIPELLDRHPDLRQGAEWDQMQRVYVSQQQALRKNIEDAAAYLTLAQLFANEARVTGEHGHYYPGALNCLEKGLAVANIEPDLRFRLLSVKSSVELSQHDFSQALATAQQAVAINPYNAQIYGALVDAYVELGNYAEAVEMADKMISIRPDLRSYSRVSYLREIHGDVPGAIEAMKLAVSAGFPGQEGTCWARMTLGELYENYGKEAQAREQYEWALVERPNYPFAIAALAKLDMTSGKLEQAEEQLEQAISIIPEVGFYIDRAELYKMTGREEELATTKEEILAMLQDDVDSGHLMNMEYASLYLELYEDPAKALPYAKEEFEKRPANIDVNRLLARIHAALGNTEEAERLATKAATTNSVHPELLNLTEELAMNN